MLPILVKFGPWLLAAAGVLFGMFRHQQAATATAKAAATVAQAQATVDAGNAAAAQVGQQAVATAAVAQQQAAATPDSNLDARLADLGALRKD
ncbi:hypothetical protein QDD76_007075 [Burkholderia cepacia]|uniref:Bacteriophage protein n=1 Tax=Burkholderia contaminans TaxID=488447 RepID=A0A2S5E0A7_9BURK|nr:hypothetical protein [Burkholderia cepacia]OXI64165.1 hypothetical protein CFB47_06860 [Burkholderia sp. AU27893]POZ84732.1 hypothetical protein C3743_14590 [Burkholderia contaminans]